MTEPGARVGAIRDADDEAVRLFGYGVYDGPQNSPMGFPNPRITLDSGKVLWGYQCWWGAEEAVKNIVGTRTVVLVDPPE